MRALAVIIALLLLSIIHSAWGHDPFTGLTNQYGGSCCGSDGPSSDCKPTIMRYENGRLQAQIDDRWKTFMPVGRFPFWVDIPDDKLLPTETNPLAGPVVCWLPHLGVMCAWLGRET